MSKQIASISIELKNDNDKQILNLVNEFGLVNNLDIKIFTTNCSVISDNIKRYTILPIYEARYYHGSAFVWDLMSLELAVDFPNLDQIYFYQGSQLPWIVFKQNQTSFWDKFFNNPKVKIFTTYEEVKEILASIWKEPIFIKEINPHSLAQVINEKVH